MFYWDGENEIGKLVSGCGNIMKNNEKIKIAYIENYQYQQETPGVQVQTTLCERLGQALKSDVDACFCWVHLTKERRVGVSG